jgi:hypothetical protein
VDVDGCHEGLNLSGQKPSPPLPIERFAGVGAVAELEADAEGFGAVAAPGFGVPGVRAVVLEVDVTSSSGSATNDAEGAGAALDVTEVVVEGVGGAVR